MSRKRGLNSVLVNKDELDDSSFARMADEMIRNEPGSDEEEEGMESVSALIAKQLQKKKKEKLAKKNGKVNMVNEVVGEKKEEEIETTDKLDMKFLEKMEEFRKVKQNTKSNVKSVETENKAIEPEVKKKSTKRLVNGLVVVSESSITDSTAPISGAAVEFYSKSTVNHPKVKRVSKKAILLAKMQRAK